MEIEETKEKIMNALENNQIHQEVYCDKCNKIIPRQFRFTDWDNDLNDVYGDFECCLNWFNKAIKEDKKGRYSIYAVTICKDCDSLLEDDGVIFNEDYPDYDCYN